MGQVHSLREVKKKHEFAEEKTPCQNTLKGREIKFRRRMGLKNPWKAFHEEEEEYCPWEGKKSLLKGGGGGEASLRV